MTISSALRICEGVNGDNRMWPRGGGSETTVDLHTSSNDIRIILVEDDPEHQHLLLRALASGRSKADVCAVRSGAAFLAAIKEQRFDCAVMDFNLSDYRADELIREAASDMVGCPIIVTSCSQDQEVVIESFRSGVVDFVPKAAAVSGEVLWRSVEQAIQTAKVQVSERRRRERRERHLVKISETDPLTGLRNRRYFDRCVREQRWTEDRRRMMSCVMIDIDRFKQINDTYGHNVGDQAIRGVARAIKSRVHGSDIVIRWGGEEMLALRPSHSVAETWLWAEELRTLIERIQLVPDEPALRLTASMGIVRTPAEAIDTEAVGQADAALYLAKSRGRNCVCTHTMVKVEDVLREMSSLASAAAEDRIATFTERCKGFLGPTQRKHMTVHCQQVSAMAGQIARALQVDERTHELSIIGGLVHDIGKCMIPEELLAKPTWLTLPERALMANNARFGADICARLGADHELQSVVRGYHLRYDSTQSAGENDRCRMAGRIVCAADAISTMLADRPYRKARSASQALSELRHNRASQFDPEVVEAAHFVGLERQRAA